MKMRLGGTPSMFLLLLALALPTQVGPVAARAAQGRRALAGGRAPAALVRRMAEDNEYARRCLEADYGGSAEKAAARLAVVRVDLNRDGRADYLVVLGSGCSGVGANNTPLFAYLWTPGGYRQLFEANGLSIRPLRTSTGGYRDVIVEAHASGNDVEETVYKFEGGQYREKVCRTRLYDDVRRRFYKVVSSPCN